MDSPNFYDAKVQAVSTNSSINEQPQYYSRGQPIPRDGGVGSPLAPWAYNGTPGRLAQFAYPCRPCCPSINDIVDPANRKGGEYYNALSDVNHYDHDGFTHAWWGSAQRCAGNCGWQQGLPAKDRPPLATQPALDLRRDYEHMAPDHSHRTLPPNYTTAPLPGAPAGCEKREACGCPFNVPPIASTQGAECPRRPSPSYMQYYTSARKGGRSDRSRGGDGGGSGGGGGGGGYLSSQYAWWTHELVQALRAKRGERSAEADAALRRLMVTHRQLAETVDNARLAGVLDELAYRILALGQAHAGDDGKHYASVRTRLYEQGDLAAATTDGISRVTQDAWRAYLRTVIDQVEVQDAAEAVQVFDRAHQKAQALFVSA